MTFLWHQYRPLRRHFGRGRFVAGSRRAAPTLQWGVFLFLQVVAVEIRRHRLQLEADKQNEEDKARRDDLLPVVTANPITYEAPEIPDEFS